MTLATLLHELRVVDDINYSGSRDHGYKCYEQIRAMNDIYD